MHVEIKAIFRKLRVMLNGGDPNRLRDPGEHRFIRFFGCAPNQVCQVLPATSDNVPVSLFTRALVDILSAGSCRSLSDLVGLVAKRCDELRDSVYFNLEPQRPRLSCGELSVEKNHVLSRAIFDAHG